MLKPVLKISHRTLVLLMEVFAVLAILCAFATMAFVWRVSQGPVSIGFAKEYVQSALSNESEGFSVAFDDIVFTWPNLKGPFRFDLTGLHIQRGKKQAEALTIQKASIGLSRGALLIGLIRPVSVIVESPSLELVRSIDGRLNVLLDSGKETLPQNPTEQTAPPGQEVAQIFKDMANRGSGSFFSRLRAFEVQNASVAIRDYALKVSWYTTGLNFALNKQKDGVAATIDIPLPGGKQQDAGFMLNLKYIKDTDDFHGVVHVKDINPAIVSRFLPVPDLFSGQNLYFTGDIVSHFDSNLMPVTMQFSGSIPQGDITIPEEYDAPIAIENIMVEGSLDRVSHQFILSNLSGKIGGVDFLGNARADMKDNVISIPVQMKIDQADLERLPPLFPKSEHDGEAFIWLSKKIQGGRYSDVTLDMEARLIKSEAAENKEASAWAMDLPKMQLGFSFEGAKVQYQETLMPMENAKGKGMIDLHAQTLDVTDGEGDIGDIHATGVKVHITDLLTQGAGTATVSAALKGPLSTALQYIAAEPIHMDEKEIGIDAAKVKGMIDAMVTVSLPTLKDVPKDAVNVDIKGTLSDINIPAIVNGLPLSGGPLELATEEGSFRVKGKAQLDGRDTTLEWHQYFDSAGRPYSMQVKAAIGADQALRNKFGIDLDEYINGTMPVDLVYTLKEGNANVDVKGDLTPVKITIDPFKFEKPAGEAGKISFSAILKDDVLKQLKSLNIDSKDLKVNDATIDFAAINGKSADLYKGNLPSAQIGKTQGSMNFQVSNDNVMSIKASAPVFDLVPFLQESPPQQAGDVPKEKKQRMIVSLDAPKMLVQNKQEVRSTKTYLEMDDDGDLNRIEYDALVGKAGKLSIRFRPDETGKRIFRLETDNAGEVLYDFGVYENIHGGKLVIYGEPKGGDSKGNIYGTMRMENFRVVKAPALTKLLSLMSLTGISELLGNQGLVFSKLESGFEWRFRREGNLLIIKDGKTSGSSIGLTFSGVLDRGKKTTDVAGTIIPMTEVNSLLSKIPLVGEILGGASGLIAATYSMKGPTASPNISVNPLSVLAPGIIRRILFEGGYESKIPDDENPAPSKAPPKKTGTSN